MKHIKPIHWLTLIFLALIWGSSFILIKRGLDYFTPIQVGALRITLAGLFLLPISFKHRKELKKVQPKYLVLTAVSGSFIPMFLFPIAEVHLHSSMAGILNALMSVFVIVLGYLFYKYKTSLGEIVGVLLSFLGVILLLQHTQESISAHNQWFYQGILILAALLYAYSGVLTQKYMQGISPIVWTAFIELVLLVPGLITLISTGFFDIIFTQPKALQGIGYIVLLALFGSALANIYYYKLIEQTGATFASSVSLLMPLIAFMWGVVDGEHLSMVQLFGATTIIAGLYFTTVDLKLPWIKTKKV